MDAINQVRGSAPVRSGDVVIENVGSTGVNVVATNKADAAS